MKLIESADGSIKVVELDPTKWYWLVVDGSYELRYSLRDVKRQDGQIIIKGRDTVITFVESPDRVTHLKDVDNVGARPLDLEA
jgi:hypothetical protein